MESIPRVGTGQAAGRVAADARVDATVDAVVDALRGGAPRRDPLAPSLAALPAPPITTQAPPSAPPPVHGAHGAPATTPGTGVPLAGGARSFADWQRVVHEWVEPRHWPGATWSSPRVRGEGLARYDAYVLHLCRVRYLELETDLRTLFGNWVHGMLSTEPVDVVTGECAVEMLRAARRALDEPDPDLLAVASTLDLVERCIVWATPSYMLAARIPGIRRRIEQEVSADARAALAPLLDRLGGAVDPHSGALQQPLHEVRSAVDEGIVVLNAAVTERHIASGLQLERLSILRDRGLWLLGVQLVSLPLVMPAAEAVLAAGSRPLLVPFRVLGVPLGASDAWLAGLGVALFGAAGGFLSGLLQARASAVSMAEYQDSVLRLELRPIVGATIALVLYVLLSWAIVPGVAITSGGSYLLLAFLSGFSERYFLRLLELGPDEAAEVARRTAPPSAAASVVAPPPHLPGPPLGGPGLRAEGTVSGRSPDGGRLDGRRGEAELDRTLAGEYAPPITTRYTPPPPSEPA